MKKIKLILSLLFIFILLVGCNKNSEDEIQNSSNTKQDNYQTIDAVYIGHISTEQDTFYLDEVEWITEENEDRIKELELSQTDMPNGYYIYNPSTDKISLKLGENTEYNFVALESLSFIKEGDDRNYSTTKKEEFMEFLNSVKSDRVVFRVEVKDGIVVNITEQFTN